MVINDIKPALPDKCFIYSFVRATTAVNLKGCFKDLFCSEFIIKPQYSINKNFNAQLLKKWNYNGDITESLDSAEVVNLTNPFAAEPDRKSSILEFLVDNLSNKCKTFNRNDHSKQ